MRRSTFDFMIIVFVAFVAGAVGCGRTAGDSGEAKTSTGESATEDDTPVKEAVPLKPEYFHRSAEGVLYEVSLESTLAGAGETEMLALGVTSKMKVVSVEQLSAEELLTAVLVDPEVSIRGDSTPTEEQLAVLKMELSQPVWGRFRNGRLQKLYLSSTPSAYAVGIWRTLLSGMQASMPVNQDEPYLTSEYDGNGEARVTYRKIGDGVWQKTKRSYAKGLYSADGESPVGSAPAPRLVSSEGEVRVKDGNLESVRFDESIEVPLNAQAGLSGKTAVRISMKSQFKVEDEIKKLPPRTGLVLAADEPFIQELPMDAMDHERMKGLTFDKTLRALVARSRDPRKKALWAAKNDHGADPKDKKNAEAWTEDWARYFAALPAFFRQKPETLKRAEKEIRDGNPATSSLLGGLASSGNPAAQEVLARLALDEKLEMETRGSAVRNLVQCTMPSKRTADTVWKLTSDSDSEFTRLAVFGIGIIARKMRKNGEVETASDLIAKLIDRLAETTDPHKKRDVLRGISNSGDPAALDAVIPLFDSENPTIRGGAVEAVRLMEIPEADTLIAGRISHKTEDTAGVRASAIRAAATRSRENPILAALLEAAQFDPDLKVKKEARKLLFSWSQGDPDLTAKLEAIADADEADTEEG